ncbi:MAG TPA: sensor histidine kinase [Candidatus Acidoferrales bacterium]|nr:sensor histidine kinase [Candidatus Acidoferrales bacterium]
MTDTSTSLRFSPDILRRLGEELNPSLDQSILELVKNSFDASARECTVVLRNTEKMGGTIEISDNGDGMDAEGIINGWLILGRSGRNPEQRTRLNRVPAGSKGLGRLAALRLGHSATLRSWPLAAPQREFLLTIDWSKYDAAQVVEEVPLSVEGSTRKNGGTSGTVVTIDELRAVVTRAEVSRLARAMILLADPFGDDPEGFRPVLKASEFSDLEKLVKARYFEDAEFHLSANLDKDGTARAVITDWKGKTLFSAKHAEISTGPGHPKYASSEAQFDLWVFILNKATFSTRTSSVEEVREWLGHFGGVHLYQNGLRVSPYGNPGNDWLDMNLRRARSPEERPSTNTSIGRVSTFETGGRLAQKTDRSGFIENDAFLELKRFANDALEWMARCRMKEALKRRASDRVEAPKRTVKAKLEIKEAIERVPAPKRRAIKQAFKKYEVVREKEIKTLRKEVQLYRTLSTAGITAATFAHESAGNPIKAIDQAAKSIERRARKELGDRYNDTLAEPVELIIRSTDAMKVLGNVTFSLLDHEKRRASQVEIHEIIESVVKTYEPFFKERDVEVATELAGGKPYLRGSKAAIESIVTNFLNNSLVWFEKVQVKKYKIGIRTEVANGNLRIRFDDNGPGIEGIDPDDVWLAGETTRPNGTGLGLTIVHDAVKDLGGTVKAQAHGDLGGASFMVELPILGK